MYILLTQFYVLLFLSTKFWTKLSTYFLNFWVLKIRPVDLLKICRGSTSSPFWLYKESVMALGVVRHLWRLASAFTGNIPPKRTSLRALIDSLQSHDRLLAEPWRTPGRAMADFSQTLRWFCLRLNSFKLESTQDSRRKHDTIWTQPSEAWLGFSWFISQEYLVWFMYFTKSLFYFDT